MSNKKTIIFMAEGDHEVGGEWLSGFGMSRAMSVSEQVKGDFKDQKIAFLYSPHKYAVETMGLFKENLEPFYLKECKGLDVGQIIGGKFYSDVRQVPEDTDTLICFSQIAGLRGFSYRLRSEGYFLEDLSNIGYGQACSYEYKKNWDDIDYKSPEDFKFIKKYSRPDR